MATKQKERKTVEDKNPPKPGSGPLRPASDEAKGAAIPATDDAGRPLPIMPVTTVLLEPVAAVEKLIESFKGYVALKDKLLEATDYMWHVKWSLSDKVQRKVFSSDEDAKKFAQEITAKGMQEVELEKKIKKSGCLKLSKAFGISCAILDFYENRQEGVASYKVRATAPNGQFRDRTGSCDRREKGKLDSPFDTISATANTRAEDRAIMALVGGENTSEEFEEHGIKDVAAVDPKTGDAHVGVEKKADAAPGAGAVAQDTHDERIKAIQQHFGADVKPAAPATEFNILNRRFWAGLSKLGLKKEEATKAAHDRVHQLYGKQSIKDLTIEEFRDLVQRVEERIAIKTDGK